MGKLIYFQKLALLATVAAVVLAGCLYNENPYSAVNALNTSLQELQGKYSTLAGEKTSLEGKLNSSQTDAASLKTQLEEAKTHEANTVKDIRAIIANESLSKGGLKQKAFDKYVATEQLGCNLYLSTGGFSSTSTVSLPLYCILNLNEYYNASSKYVVATTGAYENASTQKLSDYLDNRYGK